MGIELGETEIRAVELGTETEAVTVRAAAVLPRGEGGALPALPPSFSARRAALCVCGKDTAMRLLRLPAELDEEEIGAKAAEYLGLEPAAYCIGATVLNAGRQARETRVLGVALPHETVAGTLAAIGRRYPRATCLHVAEVAALSAFAAGPAARDAAGPAALIELGAKSTLLAFLLKGELQLLRRFEFGMATIAEAIGREFGADAETGARLLADHAVDVSAAVKTACEPFLNQLAMSRQFVEGHTQRQVSRLFVSGNIREQREVAALLQEATGLEPQPWNPFAGLTLAPGAVPDTLRGQEYRFAAAVGTGLAVLAHGLPRQPASAFLCDFLPADRSAARAVKPSVVVSLIAGAVLLLGAVLLFPFLHSYRRLNRDLERTRTQLEQATARYTRVMAPKAERVRTENALAEMLALHESRLSWREQLWDVRAAVHALTDARRGEGVRLLDLTMTETAQRQDGVPRRVYDLKLTVLAAGREPAALVRALTTKLEQTAFTGPVLDKVTVTLDERTKSEGNLYCVVGCAYKPRPLRLQDDATRRDADERDTGE
ncbi:MAG: pilus assembly protein PilM [Kiritimatiellae bacterium]|nr:pilus assembly protein PilM [Kiritimatiellia bacterium]